MEIEDNEDKWKVLVNENIKNILIEDFKSQINPDVSISLGISDNNTPELVSIEYPKNKYTKEYIESKINDLGKSDCSSCEIMSVMVRDTAIIKDEKSIVDKCELPRLPTLKDLIDNILD